MLQYLRELRARYLSPHPKTRPSPVSTEDTRLRHNVRTRWPRLGDFTLDSLKLCMDLDDETPWPSSSLLALRRPLPISICSTVTTFVGLGLCGIPPPTASRYASRFSPSPPSPHSDCGSPCSTGKGDCLIVVSSAPVATSSSRDDHRAGSPASFLSTPDTNVLSKVNRSQGACSSTAAQWPPSPVTPLDPSYLTTAPDGAAAPRSSLESNKAQDTQENPSSLLFPEQELLNPSLDPTVGDVIQRETFSRAGGTDCGREQRRVVRRKPPPIQIISSPSFPKPDDVSESAEPTTEHELVANPDAGQARQHPTPVIADILPFPHGTATTHRSEDSVYDDAQITNHSSLERVQNDVHLARVAGHPPEAILYVPLAQLLAGTGTLPPAYDFGPGLVPCVPIYGLRAEEIERRYAHHTMADESGCSGHSLDVEVPLDARPQINANLDTGLPNPQRIFGTFPPPPGLPPPAAMPDALAAGNFGDRNENSSGWHIPRASLHDDNKHGAPATSTALQPGLPLPYDYQWPRCESPSQLESLDDLVTLPALPALEDQLGMNELQLSFPNDNALGPPHGLGPPFERLDTALRDLPQDGISPSFPPVVVANDLRSDYDEIVDHCEGHRTIAWGTADGGEPSGTDTSSLDCPNESPPGPPLTKEGSLVIERQPWHARTLYYDDPDTQKSPSLRCDGVSFDMVAEIATGSVGRVFAISRKNSLYAVKVIHKWRAYAEYYCDRNMMIQEKEALVCVSNARQKSPYLAHLLMSWEDEVSVYFLMPLYPLSMSARVRMSPPISHRDRILYCAELISGLQSLQSLGVLHLDLKPDNVLIDSSGRAVIADYGCSVLVEPSEYTTWRGYGVSGTHTYEAPEMYSRGVFGSKAVVFSLGVVFLDIFDLKDDLWFDKYDALGDSRHRRQLYYKFLPIRRRLPLDLDQRCARMLCGMLTLSPDKRTDASELHQYICDWDASAWQEVIEERQNHDWKPGPNYCWQGVATDPEEVARRTRFPSFQKDERSALPAQTRWQKNALQFLDYERAATASDFAYRAPGVFDDLLN